MQEETIYRRKLHSPPATAFSSPEGRAMFGQALSQGFMDGYFKLAEQFRTQDAPAFCGLSTLTMVLNALCIDPKRVWKAPWRWYHESMLDCCKSLEEVRKDGIGFDQLVCLAKCNNLKVRAKRPLFRKEEVNGEFTLSPQTCRQSSVVPPRKRVNVRERTGAPLKSVDLVSNKLQNATDSPENSLQRLSPTASNQEPEKKLPLTRKHSGNTLTKYDDKKGCMCCDNNACPTFHDDFQSIESFREDIIHCCRTVEGPIMAVNYSRKEFLQTGDGHYSCIGGYHPATDMCLILDTARFKLPPHWVKVEALYEAMCRIVPESNTTRGWIVFDVPDDADFSPQCFTLYNQCNCGGSDRRQFNSSTNQPQSNTVYTSCTSHILKEVQGKSTQPQATLVQKLISLQENAVKSGLNSLVFDSDIPISQADESSAHTPSLENKASQRNTVPIQLGLLSSPFLTRIKAYFPRGRLENIWAGVLNYLLESCTALRPRIGRWRTLS